MDLREPVGPDGSAGAARPPQVHVLYVTAGPARHAWMDARSSRFSYLRVGPDAAVMELRDPRIALVCVDASVGAGAAGPLMGFMRDREPDVPILWVAAGDSALPALGAFGDQPPDRILLRAPSPSCLLDHVDALLGAHVYSDALAELLCAAVERVLRSTGSAVAKGDCFLKSSRRPLADYASSVELCGPSLSGCVTVEAERQPLRALLRRAAPDIRAATNEHLQDLLGELGNSVVGLVKQSYARAGVQLASGPPRAPGRRATYTLAARAPSSLAAEARLEEEGTLFFQLRIVCDGVVDASAARRPAADTGEVKFL